MDRIKVSTDLLEKLSIRMNQVAMELMNIADTLERVNTNKGSGGELSFYLDMTLNNGMHITANTVKQAVISLRSAIQQTSQEVKTTSKGLLNVATLFEITEQKNLAILDGFYDDLDSNIHRVVRQYQASTVVNDNTSEGGDPQSTRDERFRNLTQIEYEWLIRDAVMSEQIISIVDKYDQDTWNKADKEERKRIVNEIIEKINKIQHTDYKHTTGIIVDLSYKMNQTGTAAQCIRDQKVITLNPECFDPKKQNRSYKYVTTSIVHEMRHAYQYSVVDNPDKYNVPESIVKKWSDNASNYCKAPSNTNDPNYQEAMKSYAMQPIESDAYTWSNQLTHRYSADTMGTLDRAESLMRERNSWNQSVLETHY